jgi:hypothetical protein
MSLQRAPGCANSKRSFSGEVPRYHRFLLRFGLFRLVVEDLRTAIHLLRQARERLDQFMRRLPEVNG